MTASSRGKSWSDAVEQRRAVEVGADAPADSSSSRQPAGVSSAPSASAVSASRWSKSLLIDAAADVYARASASDAPTRGAASASSVRRSKSELIASPANVDGAGYELVRELDARHDR